MSDLAKALDDVAEEAAINDGGEDWGPVLAVAVIHATGVRVMSYPKMLARAGREEIASALADLSEMVLSERRSALT